MTETERDYTDMAESIGLKNVVVSYIPAGILIIFTDPQARKLPTLRKRLETKMIERGYFGGIMTRQCAPDFKPEFIISEDGK